MAATPPARLPARGADLPRSGGAAAAGTGGRGGGGGGGRRAWWRGRCCRRRKQARAGAARAVAGLLRQDVPGRRPDRRQRHRAAVPRQPRRRPRRAPPLLPRLLRRRVRCVHTDRADGQQRRRGAEGGEGHGGEPEPAAGGVRHGGDGQGRRGEGVPRRRHLRRRPRARRPGLRPPGRWALLRGEEGSEGQQGVPGGQGAGQPPARQLHRGRAPPRVRRQGPRRRRPRGALGRAHRRVRALRPLPGPPLRLRRDAAAGPGDGRAAGEGAAHVVPLHRRQRPRGGALRREHPVPVRPRLLRQPAGEAGTPRLRPGAVPRRAHQAARRGARRRQGAVLPGVRGQHGQDGLRPGQEGQEGGGQASLQPAPVLNVYWSKLGRSHCLDHSITRSHLALQELSFAVNCHISESISSSVLFFSFVGCTSARLCRDC
uniref:Uncharacterized protein n=1 Tax=Oryza glumipatula TaxID=40148 RepID=A0A0D9YCW4_9ORYZ